jgi:2-polyprenyl-6-methoxyphenol hydroxylase-like FAD-dependent oxidoreductase
MPTLKPIVIVGGGLAGLTLGFGLRQRGIPVTIWEAGHYPRHRVCGEFISGRGLEVLERLGLREYFIRAGAIEAHTAAFFLGDLDSPVWPLPIPALCLSRFTMDNLLAQLFTESGGDLRQKQRWDSDFCEGAVRATGRRPQNSEDGWRWFGLKVHARDVPLVADLELHACADHYVGLCRLPEGVVNVCGLFRKGTKDHNAMACPEELLRGSTHKSLSERMAHAKFEEDSLCSVAGLALRPRFAKAQPDCSIGDALTMIPPVTGNGMSMAFEAAETALEPLVAFSRGALTWDRTRQAIARSCDALFAQRLAWARCLHWGMLTPLLRGPLGGVALHSDWLWRRLFYRTR